MKIYPHRRHVTGRAQSYLNWQIADYTTGQRKLRQFANHDAAIREAERIARQLASGQVEAAQAGTAQVQSFGRCVELVRSTGDSMELACQRYAQFVSIVGTGAKMEQAARAFVQADKVPVKTVKEVMDEMLAEKESKGREPATLQELRFRLAKFEQSFRCPIASITKSDVQEWLDNLHTSGRNVVNYRAKVSALFNYAWRHDYVLTNPVQNTERPECENGKVEIYTPDELRKLIAGASKDFRPSLCIGAFAGLRASELLRLQWADVRLDRLHIVASAKKRGTPSRRIVPILPNLAKWLAPYANKTGQVWKEDAVSFSAAKQDTATAAEVEWRHNALRHSFISYRLAAIKDTAEVALEAGNSPQMIFRHYRELVTPAEATAYFSIAPKP